MEGVIFRVGAGNDIFLAADGLECGRLIEPGRLDGVARVVQLEDQAAHDLVDRVGVFP